MVVYTREGITRGFTIVELLIVVVIIAILAAITLVTYNGIQQRANNTAIIDAASKSLRMIQAYIAANDKYPYASTGNACITTTTGCYATGTIATSSTFDTNMATIGSLPRSVPNSGADHYGVYVIYTSNFTYNLMSQPLLLVYFLQGSNQKCGLANVTSFQWPDTVTATAGYTMNNIDGSGKTLCWISIPGPAA